MSRKIKASREQFEEVVGLFSDGSSQLSKVLILALNDIYHKRDMSNVDFLINQLDELKREQRIIINIIERYGACRWSNKKKKFSSSGIRCKYSFTEKRRQNMVEECLDWLSSISPKKITKPIVGGITLRKGDKDVYAR